MCGEQYRTLLMIFSIKGSPPRVRGTADVPRRRNADEGITPACAGNRLRAKLGKSGSPDHPRVCGEQAARPARPPCVGGSPPRVRGTGRCSRGVERPQGITPACAGNSQALYTANNAL